MRSLWSSVGRYRSLPAVLASRVFVLPAAPLSPAPHSDRTSHLPNLVAGGCRRQRLPRTGGSRPCGPLTGARHRKILHKLS